MDSRSVLALFAVIAALSLVGAPITMADWGEQATFGTERIETSEVDEETPVLYYENFSKPAKNAVRRTIESADSSYTVYGQEDWPDRFFYSDYSAPGRGRYAVVYEGQYYRLHTYAGGGFPFVYWLYELPFIVYGLVLGWAARSTYLGGTSARTAVLATGFGLVFHLLGPEFDFPLLSPMEFVALGGLAALVVVLQLLILEER